MRTVPTTSMRGNHPIARCYFCILRNSKHLGEGGQSHRMTLGSYGALKCPPTGMQGLRGVAHHIQCDRS
jgi:hypothetical protein